MQPKPIIHAGLHTAKEVNDLMQGLPVVVSGTADAGTGGRVLIDAAVAFITAGVTAGHYLINRTRGVGDLIASVGANQVTTKHYGGHQPGDLYSVQSVPIDLAHALSIDPESRFVSYIRDTIYYQADEIPVDSVRDNARGWLQVGDPTAVDAAGGTVLLASIPAPGSSAVLKLYTLPGWKHVHQVRLSALTKDTNAFQLGLQVWELEDLPTADFTIEEYLSIGRFLASCTVGRDVIGVTAQPNVETMGKYLFFVISTIASPAVANFRFQVISVNVAGDTRP